MNRIDEHLRKRIEQIRWYHEFDFGEGVITHPPYPYKALWKFTESFLDGIDFRNKMVLDVGCWDGYWSFYAERRGAKYVLATDATDQRWGDDNGFWLAHTLYNSKVEYRGNVSVYDIVSLNRQFDIILFLGVYYHLTHPMYAFTQIRHLAVPQGEVIVEGGALSDNQLSYMEFYYGTEGSELYRVDQSNWFVPTRRCLKDMLQANYFEILRENFLPHSQLPHPDMVDYGRAIIHARAVEKNDNNHPYKPPFELHRYDPRFSQNKA